MAAAIEIDALSINTLSHLYDVASLIGEVTCAIGCQPRCLHLNEFGEETANEVGRFVEWHRALCGELQDRISARLFDMAATAQREGAAELLDDVNEALHTRS
ncbi:protein of unassigned function [Methylobacterium oryzae CBMB20]|uniref:Protein of unassigned function n=1 Tax=Methylobacterium oryzae CBMB20 TaxID=693986 RepID=A0A089NZB1_9HYPH|nr:protein of unassigned function [Methylobacterium oryzae CBMB20]